MVPPGTTTSSLEGRSRMASRRKPKLPTQGKSRTLGDSARAWRVRLYAPEAGGVDIGGHKSAHRQYTSYASVPWSDKRRSDLLFHDWEGDGHVDHIGTFIGDGQMIQTWQVGSPLQVTALWTSDHMPKVARPFV